MARKSPRDMFIAKVQRAASKVECIKCKRMVPRSDTQTGDVQVSRQTHWEPAEYETQTWCNACIARHEQQADGPDPDADRD